MTAISSPPITKKATNISNVKNEYKLIVTHVFALAVTNPKKPNSIARPQMLITPQKIMSLI